MAGEVLLLADGNQPVAAPGRELSMHILDHARVAGAFGWALLWVSPMAEIGPLIRVREASHELICGGWVNQDLPP